MASLGLPSLAGFWGEFMALLGSYNPLEGLNVALFRTLMVIGAIGTVLTAGYMLWMLQKVNFGEPKSEWDGKHFHDVDGFFVIATQNPLEQTGTFPLPESQMDRFLMRIEVGYPDREAERKLLKHGETKRALTCFSMPAIRFNGTPGRPPHSKRPGRITSRSFCRSAMPPVTGAM